ncbi:MAG: YchJ family protein [Bacillota bacterium]
MNRNDPCPCGSGKKYKACCGLAHTGVEYPADPEQLIRSRYTAYVIGNVDYLYKTTHPSNEAVNDKSETAFKQETLAYCQKVEFTGLTIHETTPEDDQGISRGLLTARFKVGTQPEDSFTERSEFIRVDGRLLYLRGTEVEVGVPQLTR